ncbi:MAG: dCTP deaminase [Nitrospirota bacterium]
MILSNTEIHKAILSGEIVVDPFPDLKTNPYDATSINLRLGNTISTPQAGKPFTFDLRAGGLAPFLADVCERRTIDDAGYTLHPHKFVLTNTKEYIKLPPHFAARVEGKSSFARCGLLVHFTAPTIHAGYEGRITLELINLGWYPITLYPDIKICQLIIERVEGEVDAITSQFQGQTLPEGIK